MSDVRIREMPAHTPHARVIANALQSAISVMTGKNVPDTVVQKAVRACEIALQKVRGQ